MSRYLALLFSAVHSARVAQRGYRIAGLPVHNYFAEAEDFVLLFKKGTGSDVILKACAGRCSMHGNPDVGGAAWAAVKGRDNAVAVVDGFQEDIELVEVDVEDFLIPDEEVFDDVPAASASWGLDSVGAPQRSSTGAGVHIYIQDTGMKTTHQDFGGRASAALDMTSGKAVECQGGPSNCAYDAHGHGTHCGGTAAGNTYGVAPGATIHAVKTLNPWGGSRSWQFMALEWVIANGEKPAVISMSLGGQGQDQGYRETLGAVTAAGMTVVVAAGNSNADACNFSPAFAQEAITVGATDVSDQRAYYSNYGSCNDIMAPGSNIISADSKSDGSRTMTGTSMACPHVSGAAALLLEADPSLTKDGIMAKLTASGKVGAISGLKANDPDLFLNVVGF